MSIDYYLKTIRKFVPLTKEEEKVLFKKAKAGDREAYNEIIESNLRFVVSVAKKYQNLGILLEDLISEGNMGLVKAYEKFDVDRNYKFITYAVWWIKQSILNAIHEHSNQVRLPLNKINNITKSAKLRDNFEQGEARSLSIEELAEYIDDPDILNDLKYQSQIIDLDKPQVDGEKDLNNIITDKSYCIDTDLEFVQDELVEILKDFTPREREILYMYYGINQVRPYTLKEIGYDMGLTRERIRQIKEKVIDKLKKKKLADRLREYL